MCPNDHLPWFHPNCPARPSTCHHQCVWTTNHVVPTLARLFHIDRSNLEASGYLSPLLMTRPTIYWHVYDSPQWKAKSATRHFSIVPSALAGAEPEAVGRRGNFLEPSLRTRVILWLDLGQQSFPLEISHVDLVGHDGGLVPSDAALFRDRHSLSWSGILMRGNDCCGN